MNLVILANLIHVNLVNSCKLSDSGNSEECGDFGESGEFDDSG